MAETYLIIPAGDIRINFLTILLYFIANSNASNPPNDDPIIITSVTFNKFRKFFKKLIKKSTVYSTCGFSLYPNPTISGIINLYFEERDGMIFVHLSAEPPNPCKSRIVGRSALQVKIS